MIPKKKVVLIGRIAEEAIALLKKRKDLEYEVIEASDEPTLIEKVRGVDAIAVRTARLTHAVIEAAAGAKVISRHGVGYDNISIASCTEKGIPVTILGAVNSVAVAEHTMFLILAAAKRAIAFDRAVRRGDFAAARAGRLGVEIQGKVLFLVGVGRIGSEVAKRAVAFGLKVLAFDPFARREACPDVEFLGSLDEGLEASDIVSLHVPLTDETRNFISSSQLDRMKKGSILINASRGGLVDEVALAAAISSGHLFAAGLDVFVEEPLPASSPLTSLEDIVLSPHNAGLASETLIAMGLKTIQNLLDGLDGRLDPSLVVNPPALKMLLQG